MAGRPDARSGFPPDGRGSVDLPVLSATITQDLRVRSLVPLAVLALLPLSAVITAPADAVSAAGSITSPNIVLFDSCDDHDFHYDLAVPSDAAGWSADIDAIGPDGAVAGSAFVYGDGSDDDSGTDELFLCGDLLAGRYRFRADVEYYDVDYDDQSYRVDGGSFTVRYPRSKVMLKAKRGSRLRFNASVKDERPRGFYPSAAYTTVLLQQKKGKRWVRVASSDTDSKGRVHFTRPNGRGRETFRARTAFASYDDIADSSSRSVTLN